MIEALHGSQLIDARTLQGGRWRLRIKGQTRCDPSAASWSPNSERQRSENPQDGPEEAGPSSEEGGRVCPTGNKRVPTGAGPRARRRAPLSTTPSPPLPPARLPTQMARLSVGSSSSFLSQSLANMLFIRCVHSFDHQGSKSPQEQKKRLSGQPVLLVKVIHTLWKRLGPRQLTRSISSKGSWPCQLWG